MLSCSDVIPIWQKTKNIKSFFFNGKIKPIFFIIDNLINFLNPSLYKKLGCQFLTLGKRYTIYSYSKDYMFYGFLCNNLFLNMKWIHTISLYQMSTFFLLFMTFCMVRTIDKWVNNVLFVHGTLSVPLVEFLLFF